MTEAEELSKENQALRDRIDRICRATLRVNESLDLTKVLDEVVENARILTGARYGVITTEDGSAKLPAFVTSGLAPEERQALLGYSGRWKLYKYLSEHPEPLKIADISAKIAELGLPGDLRGENGPFKTFLAVPLRHRGAHVGNFFLADKEAGQEFTDDDQEILVMFGAQAASAIANALRYRDEVRVKADLEALIDTVPVGVVVIDANTGKLLSVNREAERIAGGLRLPDHTPDQLLEVVSFRRADGREISLKENPLPETLLSATTVRAEQIVVQIPEGRSVTTLVNATPIRSEDGQIDSVVVTVQDMTPLEELERMRAEFLGMVSHELRAPLLSVKGCTATVLGSLPDTDRAEMVQFFRVIDEQADHMRVLISDLLDVGRIEAGTLSVDPEPSSVADLVDQARKRFLSAGGLNPLEMDLAPDLPRVLADRRRISQVVGNLLSNAAKHSPDTSPIRISAVLDGVRVAISVTDEGVGVEEKLLPHLFRKFFRTDAEDQSQGIRGDGLGLAISKGLVEAHGGRIWAESRGAGQGTKLTFTIPVAYEVAGSHALAPVASPESPETQKSSILVVDDDPHLLQYVREILEEAGFSAISTGDPGEVSGLIDQNRPDLVLLDLILPGTDGIELMENTPPMRNLPVIFLSGYGREETVARALEKGAVDYVVKPFSPTELVARIRAAIRGRTGFPKPYVLGDLAVNYEERKVALSGRPLKLTPKEFDLLRELSSNAGRVLTNDILLRRIWTRKATADIRLVRAFMKKLRRKLGDDPASPKYIYTVRGVGYRMPRPSED